MARKALIEKNLKRKKLISLKKIKRKELKQKIYNKNISLDERFPLVMQLNDLPRDSSAARFQNRCELTGRPRGYYRKFGLCRNKLRELASTGKLPGVIKASWG